MNVWFELWDADSANIVGDFETRDAALGFVLDSFSSFGLESVQSLVLTKESSQENEPEILGTGADLVELAKSAARVDVR